MNELSQENLVKKMVDNAKIGEDVFASRGFYIVIDIDGEDNQGIYYLFEDGIIRDGVRSPDSNGFWQTKDAAQIFLDKWKGD